MAPDQRMEANQERAVITFTPKGKKRTQIGSPFHIHCIEKLIINVRPDMSIVPQGIVACSITPCLILDVMIAMTALGKNFP